MTSTPYTDAAPAIRDAGRRAARHKLDGLIPDHLAEQVAHEIADAVLEAVLPQIAADRVTIPGSEGYGEPVHWTVYNAMHQRALYAEYQAAATPATANEAHPPSSQTPEAIVQATTYTVNCVPDDDLEGYVFALTVEYRGRGLWAVTRNSSCLSADGTWDYEMRPSSREDEWLAAHRFDLETALKLAKEAAPHITVNGHTVAESLQRMAEKAGDA